jgi:CRP/FNR family transcriptional regulator, anaerobic regulatory protein
VSKLETSYHYDALSHGRFNSEETEFAPRLYSAHSAKPLTQLRAGQTLFFEGDTGSDVFQLVKGTVSFHRFISVDCRVVLGFSLPDEVFSLSHEGRYLCSAEAVSDCLFRRLTRSEIDSMKQRGDTLLETISAHLRNEPWRLQLETLNRLHLTADESVARFICEIGQRTNKSFTNGSRVHLDMSRADIASYLGVTVETVVRALKRLTAARALIAFAPHDFGICDIERLLHHAGNFRH